MTQIAGLLTPLRVARQLAFDFSSSVAEVVPVLEAVMHPDESGERSEPPRSGREIGAVESFTKEERAVHLTRVLSDRMAEPLRVIITDNKRMMISAKPSAGRLEVRLHHMFLFAEDPVLHALARYLVRRDRKSGRTLDAFITDNGHRIDRRRRRSTVVRPRGRVYDLRALFEEQRPLFEENMDGVKITWGRLPARTKRQRSLQLGSYYSEDQIIRIHPVLDQAWVPHWYVGTVVFHEMLHHALPAVRVGRQLRHHTPLFRKREAMYEHHEAAQRWEDDNFRRLLRSVRSL